MFSAFFIFSMITLIFTPHLMALIWFALERKGRSNRIYSLQPEAGQIVRELKNSVWMPLHALVAFLFYSMAVFADASGWGFLLTLVLTYVWAEVFHYYSHKLFHHPRFLWIHREHHKSKVCTPFTSLSFSFTEKLIFSFGIWSLPALLGLFIPINYYGVWAWYLGYLIINSFSHSNFEIRSLSFVQSRPGRYLTSPTYHALHHSRYIKNYGLGTRMLDQAHDTEWQDYLRTITAVLNKKPMKGLKEKS